MSKARLVFDGDNTYIGKDARIYKIKDDIASKIDGIPGVVDSLDSTSATDALSANMGRTLQDQINSLSGTGKFLSTWDCTTGLPVTNPQEDPYTYKIGDYYVVSATGSTNYKPHGGTYTQGVPSTTVELENVGINDKYYFDGADWARIPDTSIQISIDTALSTTSTNAVENRAIANAVNAKQNTISDLSTIRNGAAAGATALQPNDNISQLTNNIGYQTAGDVNSAIQSAVGQLTTVNDGVLTIQKNNTTIDTFSANTANNKTINISVPTTVAELSDANNYATKTDLGNAIDGLIHEGSTAPQNPQEGDLWYDTVNHVLKIYNGTSWETVDTDTNTTYTAGNGINISAQNEISVDTSVIATKQYVDDSVADVIHSGGTAPQNPQEGDLWYDTVNHALKIYDGTNWNIVGNDVANINTKTFYLSGTGSSASVLAEAQPALDWGLAGKNPIIIYDNTAYILRGIDNYAIFFRSIKLTKNNITSGYSTLGFYSLNIKRSGNTATEVTTGISSESVNIIDTDVNYVNAYIPQYDGSPATKKYVDDSVASITPGGLGTPVLLGTISSGQYGSIVNLSGYNWFAIVMNATNVGYSGEIHYIYKDWFNLNSSSLSTYNVFVFQKHNTARDLYCYYRGTNLSSMTFQTDAGTVYVYGLS